MSDLREILARHAHDEQWRGWMRYFFECGSFHTDGTFTIRADKVERWYRQMKTDYDALTEQEKESDRAEADTVLAIVGAHSSEYEAALGMCERRVSKLRAAIDQAVANLRGIVALNDEPYTDDIVRATAALLAAALKGAGDGH